MVPAKALLVFLVTPLDCRKARFENKSRLLINGVIWHREQTRNRLDAAEPTGLTVSGVRCPVCHVSYELSRNDLIIVYFFDAVSTFCLYQGLLARPA